MKTIEKIIPGQEHNESAPKINAHRLDEFGRELVDGRPMEPPVGYKEQPSLFEQMRAMMHQASLEAAQAGEESFDEANDFYVEDDPLSGVPPSQYEFDEDAEMEIARLRQAQNTPQETVVAENPGDARSVSPGPSKGKKPTPEPLPSGEGSGEGA